MVRFAPLLLTATLASVAAAAPVAAPGFVAPEDDINVVEAYKNNLRLEDYMNHKSGDGAEATEAVRRETLNLDDYADEDEEIRKAYAASPRLGEYMYPERLSVRATSSSSNAGGNATMDLCSNQGAEMFDIKQTTLNDCWLAAAMLTMAYLDPWWPISRFATPGGRIAASRATVTLTPSLNTDGSATTYTHVFHTSQLDSSTPYSTADDHWWPAAIEDAVWAFGSSTGDSNILMNGGYATDGLRLLTGYEPTYINTTPNNKDEIFSRLKSAKTSPVLLTTLGSGTAVLQKWHVYAVLDAVTASNGTQLVALRNPHGFGQWYEFENIYGDATNIAYLLHGETGPGQTYTNITATKTTINTTTKA
jgi:hypothetical protein